MWVHVYVNSSRDLPSIKSAVEDHGCEVAELELGLYEVRVHDPNGDAEDEVTEYLNDAGIEAEVSYENPQTEGKPKAYDLLISGNLLSVVVNGKSGTIQQGLPRETCPSCDQADCCNQCDGSQGADDNNKESEEDAIDRTRYNMRVRASRWTARSTLKASKRPWKLRGMLSARKKIHRGTQLEEGPSASHRGPVKVPRKPTSECRVKTLSLMPIQLPCVVILQRYASQRF